MATEQKNKNDMWLRIDLSAATELMDALSNFVTEIGAEGIYQESLFPAMPETEEQISYESLTCYLPWEKRKEYLASLNTYLEDLSEIFPELTKPTFAIKEITAPDWEEEWKKYFHPFRIGKKVVIKPTWEIYKPAVGDVVVEIDPGMAFGTGQHASTMMCLEAMEEIVSQNSTSCRDVLDVGTGTGILGIAAAKFGAKRVLCTDIDGKAVEIACGNAALNQVEKNLTIRNIKISSLQRQFNLIMANLTAKLLIELSGDLERLLSPGGALIISGITEQNRQEIEACFFSSSLVFCRRINRQEWLCYIFTKK
jgi:ribosomal protein L11 methyltransferase